MYNTDEFVCVYVCVFIQAIYIFFSFFYVHVMYNV